MAERNNAIDFVKGFLVVAMAFLHTLNYCLDGKTLLYCYVSYVGPAFIFFSGYICGTIYFDKFKKDERHVSIRLAVRSLKLALLFFGINILIHLVFKKNYTGQRFGLNQIIDNFGLILLKGDAHLMSFEILLPISYVLLLSLPILQFAKFKYFAYVFMIFVMSLLSLSDIKMSYNFSNALFGVAGVYTGLLCTELKSKLSNRLIGFLVTLILFVYFFVLIPKGVDVAGDLIILFIYVNVVIGASYFLGSLLGSYSFFPRVIIKFGQYSLYLYLAQIFFLQIFFRFGLSKEKFITTKIFVVFAVICCSMIVLSYLTDQLRSRFLSVDKTYRFIFA